MKHTIKTLGLSILLTFITDVALSATYPSDDFGVPAVTTSGFYLNLQIGGGRVELDDGMISDMTTRDFVSSTGSTENGVAGRLALGYDINSFFGVELGGDFWQSANIKWTETPNNTTGTGTVKNYAVDILGKIDIHVYQGFHVFAKGGGAFISSSTNLRKSNTIPNTSLQNLIKKDVNQSHNTFKPMVAGGVAYMFNPNWEMNVNYNHIFGSGSNLYKDNYVPNLSMLTVGVQYNV